MDISDIKASARLEKLVVEAKEKGLKEMMDSLGVSCNDVSSTRYAYRQGFENALKFLEKVNDAVEICAGCGKLIFESDDYFNFDGCGCFCEKCMKEIDKQSKIVE